MKMFANRWGKLRQIQIPSSIFHNGTISLEVAALKVLCVLHYIYKYQKEHRHAGSVASVNVGQERLMMRTGYSRKATISEATKNLGLAGYVEIEVDRKGDRKSGSSLAEYTLLAPRTGEAISTEGKPQCALREPHLVLPHTVLRHHGERRPVVGCKHEWE